MKSVFKQLAAAALLAVTAVAQDTFRVETPNGVVVCRPVLITWVGGEPPYFLSILPGNQPSAPALIDFGTIESGNTFRWVVNIEAGTELGINLRDSTGALVQSAPFIVQAGTDTSCVGQDPSSSASGSSSSSSSTSASGSSSSGSGSSTSSVRSTSIPATPTSSRATGSSVSRTSSASPSGSSAPAGDEDAAAANYVPAALAGLVGAAVVLLA